MVVWYGARMPVFGTYAIKRKRVDGFCESHECGSGVCCALFHSALCSHLSQLDASLTGASEQADARQVADSLRMARADKSDRRRETYPDDAAQSIAQGIAAPSVRRIIGWVLRQLTT
jgi:hypothetical protein